MASSLGPLHYLVADGHAKPVGVFYPAPVVVVVTLLERKKEEGIGEAGPMTISFHQWTGPALGRSRL